MGVYPDDPDVVRQRSIAAAMPKRSPTRIPPKSKRAR